VLPIAIDVMSGDHEPREYITGALRALQNDVDLRALLVGQSALIEFALERVSASLRQRIEVVPASQIVAMDEPPREAIRRKKNSSMRVAVDLVKEDRAAACVSAGNTGALTSMAHFVLKTVGQVERAAIISPIPSKRGHTLMLDLGANIAATASQLQQFALMGMTVARAVHGIETPRVGLLNIGKEATKGHYVVQSAHALLSASDLNYVGFVEGDDIFTGDVDVVVTDGFTGNIALKTMEGAADLIGDRLRREFGSSLLSRLGGVLASPVLRRVGADLDPRRYNGACMVGLDGIVVKSHGRADKIAFSRAIALAALAARRDLTGHIARALNA